MKGEGDVRDVCHVYTVKDDKSTDQYSPKTSVNHTRSSACCGVRGVVMNVHGEEELVAPSVLSIYD